MFAAAKSRHARSWVPATAITVVAVTTLVASAAPQAGTPSMSHRALSVGFEPDPELPSELPPGFYRLLSRDSDRPGLPPFGRVRANDVECAAGGWSLEFALAGGAMAVATEPALIPARAGEIFDAGVKVLAPALERSSARLVLRALGTDGAPVQGAEWIASTERAAGWNRLELRTAPMPPGTRALELALEVRPRDEADPSGDVTGTVAFDEVVVWRVPRVHVDANRGGAPVGEAPRGIEVVIDDPIGGASSRGRLRDADGAPLLSWSETTETAYSIDVPPVGPGSLQLEIDVVAGDRVLDSVSRAIVVAPPEPRRASVGTPLVRFALWIDRPAPEAADRLLQALRLLRPDAVIIDVGDPAAAPPGRLSIEALRRFVDDLRLEGIEPVLRLPRLPVELAARLHIEIDDPAAIFARTDDAWREAFGPWFELFGHVVSQWMIPGASSSTTVHAVGAALDGLAPGFVEIEDDVRVIDAPPDGSRRSADVAALAAIEAWRAGAALVALRGAIDGEPGAAALAFRALASAARGARSSADLEAGSEIGCLLLTCQPTARVLVWRRDGGAPRRITLPFDGSELSARDALGAEIAMERRMGAVVADIGSSPVVIDGVDPVLGAFLASLSVEPAIIAGSTAEQPLAIRMTNPWDVTMEGTLRFVAPVDWSFIPRRKRFSLPPGATEIIQVQTTLPRTQLTGAGRVGIELEFTSDRGYSIRVDPPLSIEVRDFDCEASVRPVTLADGRPGAVVELVLTNRSNRAIELESTLTTLSGLARRDGPVRLEPDASARRTIRVDEAILGPALVTVNQTNGPLRLVRTVQ